MRLRLVAILVVLASVIAAWQAETRAELRQRLMLRSLAAQLAPLGALAYGQTSAHFWGSGEISELRFVYSDGPLAGHALHIPRLSYRRWQDGSRWPARFELHFDTAILPLAAPWPGRASGTVDWLYRESDGALDLRFSLDAPKAASVQGSVALRLAKPAELAGATLRSAGLSYRDQGLAQGERAALALRLGADPQNANAALAEAIAQWLQAQGLPPTAEVRQALADFARDPLALTIRLDPPGPLRPDTLPLFAPADRLIALGMRLSAD
ncbi:MAG: hypothetical protein V4709_12880 [Pseudomonadota bacterium]